MDLEISKKEFISNILMILIGVFVIAKLFYGNWLVGFLILPLSIPIFLQRKQKIREMRIQKLERQFKDMLISVSDALNTGYSIENAIRESYRDMLNIYGYDSDICRELRMMISRLKLNVSVETVIEEFAGRVCLKNAKMFSQIFSVAKKMGGDMSEAIKNVTDDIMLRESVKEEISIVINEKKTEQKIMTIIPIFLTAYVSISSPGFLEVMYETWVGKIVMSICLICYIAAYLWAEKITRINI